VKLLNIANKDKMVPILNMYIVCVYVVQGESLDSEMWFFFEHSPRAKGTALGEGPLFTESKTLTEGCFHQILSKNSK
jgi:hypothetical protein